MAKSRNTGGGVAMRSSSSEPEAQNRKGNSLIGWEIPIAPPKRGTLFGNVAWGFSGSEDSLERFL